MKDDKGHGSNSRGNSPAPNIGKDGLSYPNWGARGGDGTGPITPDSIRGRGPMVPYDPAKLNADADSYVAAHQHGIFSSVPNVEGARLYEDALAAAAKHGQNGGWSDQELKELKSA